MLVFFSLVDLGHLEILGVEVLGDLGAKGVVELCWRRSTYS
jgi:hypothetical protein